MRAGTRAKLGDGWAAVSEPMMPLIEDYAFLSDLQTSALVRRDGSIDWCCFPRFDSDACFAALLGHDEHGSWRLAPTAEGEATRHYLEGSLVVETRWRTSSGRLRVLDFMPPRREAPTIVRIVEGLSGRVAVRSDLVIRFGYGRIVPQVSHVDQAWVASAAADALCLRTSAPTRGENRSIASAFTVEAGQRVQFTLSWYPSHGALPAVVDPDDALREAQLFWTAWSSRCAYDGPYRDEVVRSLIVLKGLTFLPSGGIVAAATTSLPEAPGGVRNWDYRYCWLRDATLTLLAFFRAGYIDEAEQWRTWLLRAVAGDPDNLQIMYGVAGERRLPEWTAGWLPGFENSRPVRIGTPPPSSTRSTSTAKCLMRCIRRAATTSVGHFPPWSSAGTCSAYWSGAAANPTRGSGKSAASEATSPTRR
jgi:GH15 family glucan-1,4-alpha-glucosidase